MAQTCGKLSDEVAQHLAIPQAATSLLKRIRYVIEDAVSLKVTKGACITI
ncbi:hypothetical protein KCP78_10050 [Salmonella enterica subsp. enterica]|nr:hypothetical protein KCP78_10050 [Salmonella enterica subsp. enterica]